ncbi:MAG: hypothetical protein PHW04_07925 [Candidatus Wallbacteria bacterium]|nr:hypothetical protein [Candidatus Wallbacteria bacterium]
MMKKVLKYERFSSLDRELQWKEYIRLTYGAICDIVHTKGQEAAQTYFHSVISSSFDGINVMSFEEKSCAEALDRFLEVVGHIAIMLCASNPIITVGLDLESKFGLNGPVSGFFNPDQAARLFELLPTSYREFFKRLQENDAEVKACLDGFNNLPDITEEEIEKQMGNDCFNIVKME